MNQVLIFDTTLRDGEQSPGATMTPAEKLRMAHQLDALGVDVIEAGFPISSPDNFLGVQQIAAEVRRPVIAALARSSDLDIDRAARALEHAERGRIHVFIATSDIHLAHKLCITREQCLERAVAAVERARRYCEDVEFSAEDATRTDVGFLCQVMEAAIAAGATTVNIPDTVGYTHPAEYRAIMDTLFSRVKGIERAVVSVHCHNDLGLAVANTLAAVEGGARQVECTINGIGERAGNAALEEFVMALRVRGDSYPFHTGINTGEIYRASQLLTHLTGIHPQPNKAIVGKNAFAHEAGIHQDGVIKNPLTYEIMTPQMVGVPSNALVLGKHSGRAALGQRFRELGYELDADGLDRAYGFFKLLCDRKKTVLDEDLIAILHHGNIEDAPQRFHLRELYVVCGTRRSEARVRIDDDGRECEATCEGDGPLAASFGALEGLVPFHVELQEMEVHSATPGGDAVGEVSLRVRVDGKVLTGTAASTDVVDAGVRAYLNALNKAAQIHALEAKALEDSSYLWGV
ncbi:MAG TPA: 2-isopropylmalate synthase [Longimicrobium sp.]|jgi:2-isopropylmalate synthase